MLDDNLLRATHFAALAQFPPLPRFGETQLQELYVKIKQRHDYASFTSIQNGAKLFTEEIRDCLIARDRVRMAENIQTSFSSFSMVKENFYDVYTTIKEELRIPVYFNTQFILRAFWELNGSYDSFNLIQSKLLRLQPEQLSLLGIAPSDGGVRIACPQLPKRVHDFKIESLLRNHKYLFIELQSSFPQPIQKVQTLQEQMQECYNFLFENIKNLLQSAI